MSALLKFFCKLQQQNEQKKLDVDAMNVQLQLPIIRAIHLQLCVHTSCFQAFFSVSYGMPLKRQFSCNHHRKKRENDVSTHQPYGASAAAAKNP